MRLLLISKYMKYAIILTIFAATMAPLKSLALFQSSFMFCLVSDDEAPSAQLAFLDTATPTANEKPTTSSLAIQGSTLNFETGAFESSESPLLLPLLETDPFGDLPSAGSAVEDFSDLSTLSNSED